LNRPTRVVSVGKASAHMAAAFGRWSSRPPVEGVVAGTHCDVALPRPLTWVEAGHPVPTSRSVAAGARALAIARGASPGDLLLVLLSGGASALAAVPAPGLTLGDKQETTRRLLFAGADIHALNTVRKHLSAFKGGQVAAASPAPTLALVVSDVVGDDPSVIGSGPTVPDASTFADALGVLSRFGGTAAFPDSVVRVLHDGARGGRPETPKPGDERARRAITQVIGSRASAASGAARAAESLGYRVVVRDAPIVGEARDAGPRVLAEAVRLATAGGPAVCVVTTGETTVRVTGGGRGGRNQELVLAAVEPLSALEVPCALLSGGTDGVDGPTDAAGAIADSTSLRRSADAGAEPVSRYLGNNDAYRFFEALGDLVITGPTDTNVGDIQVVLVSARTAQ
jgi:glycerate 2-kinase